MPTQQDKLYTAEREIVPGMDFLSVSHVQDWVNDLREVWWWEAWVPQVLKIEVDRAPKGQCSQAWFEEFKQVGTMLFDSDTPDFRTVVHELAHVLASARRYSTSHDPWHARILLELTCLLRGPEIYMELLGAFIKHGIDYDAGGLA